jgi:antitoxin ParD1/3/4
LKLDLEVTLDFQLFWSEEYSSKSELVNDLIRQARKQQRQIDWISSKLELGEKSGFTEDNKKQILASSKALLNG